MVSFSLPTNTHETEPFRQRKQREEETFLFFLAALGGELGEGAVVARRRDEKRG